MDLVILKSIYIILLARQHGQSNHVVDTNDDSLYRYKSRE